MAVGFLFKSINIHLLRKYYQKYRPKVLTTCNCARKRDFTDRKFCVPPAGLAINIKTPFLVDIKMLKRCFARQRTKIETYFLKEIASTADIIYRLGLDASPDAQNTHQNQQPNKTSPERESVAEEKNSKCHFKLNKVGLQQTIGGSTFQSKGLFTEGSQQPAPPPTPVPPFLPQLAGNTKH